VSEPAFWAARCRSLSDVASGSAGSSRFPCNKMRWISSQMRRGLQVLWMLTVLTACNDATSPLASGQVTVYKDKIQIDQWFLSEEQLTNLSRWLDQHRSNWNKNPVEPAIEPGILSLDPYGYVMWLGRIARRQATEALLSE
jgi:hypothetical protein